MTFFWQNKTAQSSLHKTWLFARTVSQTKSYHFSRFDLDTATYSTHLSNNTNNSPHRQAHTFGWYMMSWLGTLGNNRHCHRYWIWSPNGGKRHRSKDSLCWAVLYFGRYEYMITVVGGTLMMLLSLIICSQICLCIYLSVRPLRRYYVLYRVQVGVHLDYVTQPCDIRSMTICSLCKNGLGPLKTQNQRLLLQFYWLAHYWHWSNVISHGFVSANEP